MEADLLPPGGCIFIAALFLALAVGCFDLMVGHYRSHKKWMQEAAVVWLVFGVICLWFVYGLLRQAIELW